MTAIVTDPFTITMGGAGLVSGGEGLAAVLAGALCSWGKSWERVLGVGFEGRELD